MKCLIVLSVVIANLLAASEVMSMPNNTKTGYENAEQKRSSLTHTWRGKRNEFSVPMAAKGESFTENAAEKRDSRSAVTFNDTHNTSSTTSCPTWTYPTEDGTCKCGDTLNGAIQCNLSTHHLAIYGDYCMTYDDSTGTTVAGSTGPCKPIILDVVKFYHPLTHNFSQLNSEMCGPYHRTGQLCGQCDEGYKLPVYYHGHECVMCDNTKYNWLKYVTLAFVPLTFFLFIVFCLRISATSAQLNAFILFSQVVTAPQGMRIMFSANVLHGWTKTVAHIGVTLYGIWNLDFFRTLFPGICIDFSFLQVSALDYAIAFYPLLLMIIFYVLIELHDSNCRPIVYIWKPFNRCLSRFRRQWNARASTIDAFATFLMLSYVKLLTVSVDILCPTWVYDVQGNTVGLYLYYDATVEYFGRQHLPYALITLAVMFIFLLFPLLLLILYPMKCFQRCLGCCHIKLHGLRIFADAFQGCYKDGTNGTQNCRYLAATYLIIRIILCILFVLAKPSVLLVLQGIAIFLFSISIAAARPYKPKYSIYNATDTVLTLLLAAYTLLVAGTILTTPDISTDFLARENTLVGLSYVTGLLPLVYFFYLILHWLYCCITLCNQNKGNYCSKIILQRRASQNSLPDRMVNPEYYPL